MWIRVALLLLALSCLAQPRTRKDFASPIGFENGQPAGWNFPGDAFVQDDDGYFVYQARTDDMIITAGYNVAGPEVESALLQHPAVAECGVVGKPDEERGQIVLAFVVLQPGHSGDAALVKALQDHVKHTLAPYKYPREVVFTDRLPRTGTGKLQRFALRQMAHPSTDPLKAVR